MYTPQKDSRKKGLPVHQGRQAYTCLVIGLLLLLLVFPEASRATPIVDAWTVPLLAQPQSMWNPGDPVGFTFGWNGSTNWGPVSMGLGINLGASAGTVSGNVEGLLSASYDDHLTAPGNSHIDLQFGTLPGESEIVTNLGANLRLDANFRVDFPWPIPDIEAHPSLTSSPVFTSHTDFTYQKGVQIKGRGEYVPGLTLGADIWVAGVSTQPLFYQNVYFTPGDITGDLIYTHLGTGTSGSIPFNISDQHTQGIDLPLNLAGDWALSMRHLKLSNNSFYTDIGYGGDITLWAMLLGTFKWDVDLDIYRSNEFALTFDELDRLGGSLLVHVDEGQADAVPEPGTVVLLASGLIALFGVRRARKASSRP